MAGSSPPTRDDERGPIFRPGATAVFRAVLIVAVAALLAVTSGAFAFYHSPWWSRKGLAADQPVLFSHRHHAGELRIDCRYCHSSVESSAFAGLPPTQTCLSCHSRIFTDTAMLRPVMASARTGRPIAWRRVTRTPDFVYFDHSIHVAKGIGCTTCHGDVGTMALTAKGERLDMRECVACHRDPSPYLRPRDRITSLDWKPGPDHDPEARKLLAAYGIDTRHLTNCSTCHR